MKNGYVALIAEMKKSIVQSRYIAAKLANREQLTLYFRTGKLLSEKVAKERWGSKVLEQIAVDLQKQLPGLRGFSARNLWYMKRFFEEYQGVIILQSATAEIRKVRRLGKDAIAVPANDGFWSISFTHHVLLLNKCASSEERLFYMHHASTQFWSVSILKHQLEANLYTHQGKLPNNFDATLPKELKPAVLEVFQDEYLMDFISTSDTEDERVFEEKVVADIKNFILRMGKGFCFIGNQHRLEVEGDEFYIDLLFFNRHLRCLVAFELKRGKFLPAYAGQLNFYLNVLDEKVRLENENPSIGIILCKEKKNTVVEFTVKNIDKAMGVATYRTMKEVPREMKGILPDIKEMVKLL